MTQTQTQKTSLGDGICHICFINPALGKPYINMLVMFNTDILKTV
jgi:hypothetical protein